MEIDEEDKLLAASFQVWSVAASTACPWQLHGSSSGQVGFSKHLDVRAPLQP